MQRPECALLCLEHYSVTLSQSPAVLYFRMNTLGKQKIPQKALFRCYLKLCVHWTWNQEGLLWSNCVQVHAFSWHKVLTCSECAQLSLVYCSVHKTCAERFLLHYSVAFSSPYIPGRKESKNTLNIPFLVKYPYLCGELVQQRFASP